MRYGENGQFYARGSVNLENIEREGGSVGKES